MTISYSAFFPPTVLGAAAGTLYTVAATPTTNLLRGGRMRFTNTTAGAVTVTAYAVPPAGAAADGNAFVKAKTVAANDFLDVDVPILPAGATLQALAGAAASITAHMVGGGVYA